jgi:uncharacterized protein YjbI with pentapeptide repeats
MDLRGWQLNGANLIKANLSGANLNDVSLSDAKVSGANFCDAVVTLEQARSAKGWFLASWSPALINTMGLPDDHNDRFSRGDFRGYVMNGRDLSGLDLSDVELAEASLRDADLTNTTGLTARQIRGADLRLARLPVEIADSLNTQPGVDEATRTSRTVFLTTLATCLYCWLAILSTTDAGLLVGSSTLTLPIVQTPIPVVAFFGAAPVLLLIVYFYLHFSLQNLWDALATLPAFFPDGRPLHERTLPWILSPIVRLYFKLLVPSCTPLAKFQVRATALLMWWGVPITLWAFFARFLVRQDPVITRFRIPLITSLHVILAGASVWLSLMFWRMTKETLRGIAPSRPRWPRALLSRETLAGILAGAVLAAFSVGCFYGDRPERQWSWRTAAPKVLRFLGWNAFGDLSMTDLSRRPDNWDGKDLGVIKGAQLKGHSLRNVSAWGAFAAKADFNDADLSNANFSGADLRAVNFSFSNTHLENTDFIQADLRGADLSDGFFDGAIFNDANVQGANLTNPSIEPRQIFLAANWLLAHLDKEQLEALGVCDPGPENNCYAEHENRLSRKDFSGLDFTRIRSQGTRLFEKRGSSGANLQHEILSINLRRADLSKADFRHADLDGVDLGGANLTGADLRGTDLCKVQGLTRVQVESALVDSGTRLPPALEAQRPADARQKSASGKSPCSNPVRDTAR